MTIDYKKDLANAVKLFWSTRLRQSKDQGAGSGRQDTGERKAVTAGRQLDGFISLVGKILEYAGLPEHTIFTRYSDVKNPTHLPGYFRPTKNWDLISVVDNNVLAVVEFKSQAGSFGNNFNNRIEEALGSAVDFWTAYREGVFAPSQRPWLGWLMLLEDAVGSRTPVKVVEAHFEVFKSFKSTSYIKRYELFCERIIRERFYDAACLIISDRKNGLKGDYSEPNRELEFEKFAISLSAHATAYAKLRKQQ